MTNKAGMEEAILAAAESSSIGEDLEVDQDLFTGDLDALEDLEIEDYDSDEDDEEYIPGNEDYDDND